VAIRSFKDKQPKIGKSVFIDDSAVVIGDVTLGDDVSIWPTTVLRGDVESITIGDGTNAQDGSVLHVTHAGRYTGLKVGVEPEGITVSPDNLWVASASETTNMVHWIDTKTNAIVENTLVDPRPRALGFTADSQQLWVTSEMAGTLMILDVKTKQIIKTIKFDVQGVTADKIQPVGVVIDKDRKRGYVALGPANRVAVINAQTFEVEKYLLVGQRVWNLAFSPDQKRLYTTNGTSNDISLIDLETQTVTKSIGVGTYPWGVAVKP